MDEGEQDRSLVREYGRYGEYEFGTGNPSEYVGAAPLTIGVDISESLVPSSAGGGGGSLSA